MISDKYLFTPQAKTIITRGISTNKYTGEVALHFSYHCPQCGKGKHAATFLEETGGMMRTIVLKCTCGTVYQYSS